MSIAIVAQTRDELLLFDDALTPDLYNSSAFVDAVRTLALARSAPCIRILLADPRPSGRMHSRLIELANRLTSRIAIRQLGDDFKHRTDAFLIGDRRAYVRRALATRQEAVADPRGRREARRLGRDFERMWEHSEATVELRRLHL
ncbi:hypothetical protein CKO25_01215 [Thiocapsa imhoffii]|uniref:DUF7931 domain-containing protein n=2 Tax=Thiocapsa imhoffii TaxID=382777 RepID=A0A9X1B7I7_9GAMM|nr:hypothetical protein [Thiocapsa imhoffii]